MKINYNCLPCLVNQVIKVAAMTHAENQEELYRKVFSYLSTIDFDKTDPEIVGETFALVKAHIGNNDPYYDIRKYYNQMFLEKLDVFEEKINQDPNPFEEAVKYAIIGNIIDFNPIHNSGIKDIMKWFDTIQERKLTVNHVSELQKDILKAKHLLYLGDNCGEICLDKLLVKKIKEINPEIQITFGVRGAAVVNDSIEEDAYFVGMDEYANIISNGDQSLGTVLERTSREFMQNYEQADVVIAKGQANYESLSEQKNKNIYFLMMTKCVVIAEDVGVPEKSVICKKQGISL